MSAAAPTEAPPITEEDIAILLSSLGEDNLACEARHEENGNTCSVTVTHRTRITCRGEVRNICMSEANHILGYPGVCFYCQRRVRNCWIVNPI